MHHILCNRILDQEADMRISLADAEGQLTELVRLANQGEEVILMQEGRPVVRLAPVKTFIEDPIERDKFIQHLQEEVRKKPLSADEKSKIINEIRDRVKHMNLEPWSDAAHSQDFLYDEDGLPK
jgi:prevent-host-death family protein